MNKKQFLILVVVAVVAGAAGFFVSPYLRSWIAAKKSPAAVSETQMQEEKKAEEASLMKEGVSPSELPLAVRSARDVLAARLSVAPEKIQIVDAQEVQWPNSCLGLARQEEMCLQAITPGYEVLLQTGGKEYRYRTNADGTRVRAEYGLSQ